MNDEQTEKIKNIIESSGSFALLLNKDPEEHELLAAEALKAALEEKGKSVNLLPEALAEFKKRWMDILPSEEKISSSYENFIRVPKKNCDIKEVSYESGEDFFVFKIKSERGALSAKNVLIDSRLTEIDAVFIIGPPTEETLGDAKSLISLPAKDRVISVNPNGKAVAKIIQNIILNMGEDILSRQNIATLLFAALLFEKSRRYEQSGEETAKREEELISSGADQEIAEERIVEMLSLDNLPIS